MSFAGKRILVTGGNGYIGNYFAARFVQQKATVMALSRSGTKHTHPENDRIEWLKGDILDPTPIKDKINSADIIVHTIGTLLDTSVTKKAEPGQKGTYEQMNRDTLSSLLSVIDQPKKILYISSASHPPFLQRYLTTKYEAEEMLQNSHHDGFSLRPGFIYSWKHRLWSIPIKVSIDIWSIVYSCLEKVPFIFSQQSKLGRLLRQFKQGKNISLESLGNSVLELSLNGGKHKINEVTHLIDLSTKFEKQHQK